MLSVIVPRSQNTAGVDRESSSRSRSKNGARRPSRRNEVLNVSTKYKGKDKPNSDKDISSEDIDDYIPENIDQGVKPAEVPDIMSCRIPSFFEEYMDKDRNIVENAKIKDQMRRMKYFKKQPYKEDKGNVIKVIAHFKML